MALIAAEADDATAIAACVDRDVMAHDDEIARLRSSDAASKRKSVNRATRMISQTYASASGHKIKKITTPRAGLARDLPAAEIALCDGKERRPRSCFGSMSFAPRALRIVGDGRRTRERDHSRKGELFHFTMWLEARYSNRSAMRLYRVIVALTSIAPIDGVAVTGPSSIRSSQ